MTKAPHEIAKEILDKISEQEKADKPWVRDDLIQRVKALMGHAETVFKPKKK